MYMLIPVSDTFPDSTLAAADSRIDNFLSGQTVLEAGGGLLVLLYGCHEASGKLNKLEVSP